jgi:plasmid maintenance system killer protein
MSLPILLLTVPIVIDSPQPSNVVESFENRLEALKGRLGGFHSIRVNDQRRVVFRWQAGQAFDVSVVDYH